MQSLIHNYLKVANLGGKEIRKHDKLIYRSKVLFLVLDINGVEVTYKSLFNDMIYKDSVEYMHDHGISKG